MELTADDFDLEPSKSIGDYLSALGRHKAAMGITFFVIFTIAALAAVLLPAVYKSSATILIEQQEIPEELVRSTVTSYADQRIQIITQRVMTTSNLWSLIEKYELYQDDLEKDPREVVIENMREDISTNMISADVVDPRTGRPTEATIAFQIAFLHKNPAIAQKVANDITSLFLNENLKNRQQHAEETSKFLTEESSRLKRQVSELENEIAEFKEKNSNSLPELTDLNLSIMDRIDREILEIDRQMQSLKERKIYLESEISQVSPSSTVLSETGEKILSPQAKLKVLETQYLEYLSKYSHAHPDVKRLKREIDALKTKTGNIDTTDELIKQLDQQRTELRELEKTYSETHPDIIHLRSSIDRLTARIEEQLMSDKGAVTNKPKPQSDNPVYVQLETQLKTTNSEISALLEKRAQLKAKYQERENQLAQTPQVERQYRSLLRDYENAAAKYQEVKAKQMEAKISQALETENKGEKFTLIEPPLRPERPIKPNRILIFVLGLFLAMAAAIGFAILIDAIDDTVVGEKGVLKLVGEQPMAVIPIITNEQEIQKARRLKVAVASLVMLITIGSISLVHFVIKPLDVMWFVLARKIGI